MRSTNFLNLPQRGKTEWWRYLFGYALALFFWLILGSIPYALLIAVTMVDGNPETMLDLSTGYVTGVDSMISFVVINLSFVIMLIGLFLTVRLVHGRPFRTLVTPYRRINWRRVGQGFIVYLLLVALTSVIEYAFNPEIYMFTLEWERFLPFLLLIVLMTPLQTSAEELFFRGYLLQTTAHLTRSAPVLVVINGLLFMLPHLPNPEVANGPLLLALYYFAIGGFLAVMTLRDNGLELALGAHAANNMYAAIFANYTDSVLPTEAIFTVTELNPLFGLIGFVLIAALFSLILLRRPAKPRPEALPAMEVSPDE